MKPILRAGYQDYFVATKDTLFSMRHFKGERINARSDTKEVDQ